MKCIAYLVLFAPVFPQAEAAAEAPALTLDAFNEIIGDDWTGELTYLNYGEPVKDFTIPAALEVERVESGLSMAYIYPDEPHQNSTIIVRISEDGSKLMGAPVTINADRDTDGREIRTEYACEDMGQSASCEMIYQIRADQILMRKMVTNNGETEAFRRNEYVFTR
ncbi:MAG: hypothetical protein AAFW60_01365 [Pseudomonadota bacterium]